jgi:hypothetical protein
MGGNDNDTAVNIVKAINETETQYQESLDTMYDTISEQFLKSVRRKMPVTGTRFNWSQPKLL